MFPQLDPLFDGLNNCKLTYALKANPVIDRMLIIDFWRNAKVNAQGDEGKASIETTVNAVKVVITVDVIREVLQITDSPEFSTTVSRTMVNKVLQMMNYESKLTGTIYKKYFPPFWRFLIHTFIHCISGKRSGFDEMTFRYSSAIVALVNDLEFNFSKFIFSEMVSNIETNDSKKKLFLMYPRFIQMILDAKYPPFVNSTFILDLKPLGSNSVGAMHQNSKSKGGVTPRDVEAASVEAQHVVEEQGEEENVVVADVGVQHVALEEEEEEHNEAADLDVQQEVEEKEEIVRFEPVESPGPEQPFTSHAAEGTSSVPQTLFPDQPPSRAPGRVFPRSCELVMNIDMDPLDKDIDTVEISLAPNQPDIWTEEEIGLLCDNTEPVDIDHLDIDLPDRAKSLAS
ncbi:hypothetical protein OROMI_017442 [Orobanche minor]